MANPNQPDPEALQDPERYEGGRPLKVGRSNPESDKDDTYDPSTVQVNRAREQGDGVGQKDLDYQRDATGARSAEQYSFKSDSEIDAAKSRNALPAKGLANGGPVRSNQMANQQDQRGNRQRQPQQGGQNRQPQQGQQGQRGQQTQDRGQTQQRKNQMGKGQNRKLGGAM